MTEKGDARIPIGILGATGVVGQRMVRLLADHPWFRIAAVTGSDRTVGRPYGEAVRWVQGTAIPKEAGAMRVSASEPMAGLSLVLSALDAAVAGPIEEAFAGAGILVVSNARSHRMDEDVPLLVPEVNPGHLALVERQGHPPGGGIIANPNCSVIGLALALAPLHERFRLERAHVVTLQAISGAGLPGHPAVDVLDNVIPHIAGEEEKLESETLKVLGVRGSDGVEAAAITLSAQCTRVPVTDGHTALVSLGFQGDVTPSAAMRALASFRGLPQELGLPSAPRTPIHVHTNPDHPQPRLHRDLERGMAVSVGRIQPCPVLGLRMAILSHNTVRGAAGGALLCAELAVAEEHIPGVRPPVPTDDR
jgi:aspartate-semialdehyde dehydrogenase